MNRSLKERVYWTVAITALAATLCILAVLQFRWSRELDDAASTRMRASLQSSMIGLRLDLSRELSSVTQALQVDPKSTADHAAEYVRLLQDWKRSATHPELVANIYLLQDGNLAQPQLRRLDLASQRFVTSDWPPSFESLKAFLHAASEDGMIERPPRHYEHRRQPPPDHAPPPFASPQPRWLIDLTIPALLRDAQSDSRAQRNENSLRGWIVVELNQAVLRDQLIPELAERYFGSTDGLTYDVAVVYRGANERVIYSSGSQLGTNASVTSDARVNLFGFPFGQSGPPGRSGPRILLTPGDRVFSRGSAPPIEPLRRAERNDNWELLVRHRKGSLEAALASIRRQHLAISFGVLLLLAVTISMVIVSTRRAHNLAKQQMEFVAGVSHQLRTPLAVIASAADNIADGIVTDSTKLVRYGHVIRKHARQLTQLVEQILLFSASRNQSYHYNLSRVQPREIVKTALDRSAELLSDDGFTVVQEVDPNLPDVLVDLPAICQCLQNLIANATKYSGDSRWIRIRATVTHDSEPEVLIAVDDKGIGIARAELRKIFDPFYRSPGVVGAQIRGTGLGLALARSIAESMGGRLTVTSEQGAGSSFVLHLPISETAPESVEHALKAASSRSTER